MRSLVREAEALASGTAPSAAAQELTEAAAAAAAAFTQAAFIQADDYPAEPASSERGVQGTAGALECDGQPPPEGAGYRPPPEGGGLSGGAAMEVETAAATSTRVRTAPRD